MTKNKGSNQRANVKNPMNKGFKADRNNRANQMNPTHRKSKR